MQIKTLADILADKQQFHDSQTHNSQTHNAQTHNSQTHNAQKNSQEKSQIKNSQTKNTRAKKSQSTKKPSDNQTANNTKNSRTTIKPTLSIQDILQQVKEKTPTCNTATDDDVLDNLPAALTAYLKTPEQREAEREHIKADSRLRWLAFYYLSIREHSRQELKDKLIAKQQNPDKVDALLDEFAEKGLQSEQRAAIMLIKESIRKGRGRRRIEHDFRQRKLDLPANIDEIIELAQSESQSFADYVADDGEQVNWLALAVEARVKKYGNAIPTMPKDKVKQLRFLQYRGFKAEVCYQAIKLNMQSLDNLTP